MGEAPNRTRNIRIKIVGVGGAGIKTTSRLRDSQLMDYEQLVIDSDALSISLSEASSKMLIGDGGHGARSDMDMADYYAMEKRKDLNFMLRGNDVVVVTCGLGGGTGGAITPIVLTVAKNFGAVTVAVVTYPAKGSPDKVLRNARKALKKIQELADAYIVIPNDYGKKRGLCVEKHEAIVLADKETDASILGVCAISEADWNYGTQSEETVKFCLTGAKLSVISVKYGSQADKLLETVDSEFEMIPFKGLAAKDFEKVAFCVNNCDYAVAKTIGTALQEILKARFGEEKPITLRVGSHDKINQDMVTATVLTGLHANPYEISE